MKKTVFKLTAIVLAMFFLCASFHPQKAEAQIILDDPIHETWEWYVGEDCLINLQWACATIGPHT